MKINILCEFDLTSTIDILVDEEGYNRAQVNSLADSDSFRSKMTEILTESEAGIEDIDNALWGRVKGSLEQEDRYNVTVMFRSVRNTTQH